MYPVDVVLSLIHSWTKLTKLLKDIVGSLLPTITTIMNLSLSSGIVPLSLKYVIVPPHLKKPHADSEDFTNYRPVSNLSFLSKSLEKLVAKRLLYHMDNHNLHEVMQLAYKKYHSTETALVRVQNDILTHIDNKHGVILVLLDLSAAFDTIDHKTSFTNFDTEWEFPAQSWSGFVHT